MAAIGCLGLERFTKPSNMYIDGSFFHIYVAAPDLVEQLSTRIGPLWMSHKECQQLIFGWPHAEWLAR